ncbi:hypothetical protein PYCCODRAFT_1471509 [Trametes coccinea BRFM310]|uniref:Uncharacterized protein n=1 Tax=Trametes coccinea (strain BRFM310) TaxID=1353009 RepID=A0A1Y2I9Q7_TRAC3|nr:hypothetical protein PYCCODRAFT_1471509 [Trametes coccinea BRFM310]
MQPMRMPQPAYPSSLTPLGTHVVKPRPKNVPRDFSPENPQRLPTPHRSTEELRGYGQQATAAPVQVRPQHPPASSVAMTATAEHLRALSMKAQVVRPLCVPREIMTASVNATFLKSLTRNPPTARLVPRTRAQLQWSTTGCRTRSSTRSRSRANPLPLEWKAYIATGPDYGV